MICFWAYYSTKNSFVSSTLLFHSKNWIVHWGNAERVAPSTFSRSESGEMDNFLWHRFQILVILERLNESASQNIPKCLLHYHMQRAHIHKLPRSKTSSCLASIDILQDAFSMKGLGLLRQKTKQWFPTVALWWLHYVCISTNPNLSLMLSL